LAQVSVVVLVASIEKPWDVIRTLQRLADVVSTSFRGLAQQQQQQPPQTVAALPSCSSVFAASGSRTRKGADMSAKCIPQLLGIDIPVVVVITKTDLMEKLSVDLNYEEKHWNFIQGHIRNFCMTYHASLLYTSTCMISDTNCRLLSRCLYSICYGLSTFKDLACDSYRDQIFIPASWDSKVKILHVIADAEEHLHCIDASFNNVITKPISPPPTPNRFLTLPAPVSKEEVFVLPEDDFRSKLRDMVAEPLPPLRQLSPGMTTISMSPSAATAADAAAAAFSGSIASPVQESPRRRHSLDLRKSVMMMSASRATAQASAASPTKVNSSQSLADFFHSLLDKKPSCSDPQDSGLDRNGNIASPSSPTVSSTSAENPAGSEPNGGNNMDNADDQWVDAD